MAGGDLLAVATSLVLGYVIGSLPLSALVGRATGAPLAAEAEPPPGPAAVWRVAGPGWGFLALVADLARGVLPVTLAAATFSWGAGWAAGVGAITGAVWPALGRTRGSGGAGVLPAVLTGSLAALEPALAVGVGVLALVVVVGRREFRRTRAAGR